MATNKTILTKDSELKKLPIISISEFDSFSNLCKKFITPFDTAIIIIIELRSLRKFACFVFSISLLLAFI
jgi:hypothetical protein